MESTSTISDVLRKAKMHPSWAQMELEGKTQVNALVVDYQKIAQTAVASEAQADAIAEFQEALLALTDPFIQQIGAFFLYRLIRDVNTRSGSLNCLSNILAPKYNNYLLTNTLSTLTLQIVLTPTIESAQKLPLLNPLSTFIQHTIEFLITGTEGNAAWGAYQYDFNTVLASVAKIIALSNAPESLISFESLFTNIISAIHNADKPVIKTFAFLSLNSTLLEIANSFRPQMTEVAARQKLMAQKFIEAIHEKFPSSFSTPALASMRFCNML